MRFQREARRPIGCIFGRPPPALAMDLRRRVRSLPAKSSSSPVKAAVHASDALPLPVRQTNRLFSAMFMASLYFLMNRWREKVRSGSPLHLLTLSEMAALVALVSSLIYLLSFFGIPFVQTLVSSHDDDDEEHDGFFLSKPPPAAPIPPLSDDEEVIDAVVKGITPSHTLEKALGDSHRAAGIRREALRRITGRPLDCLPLDGFNYDSILGQCCELPIGYVAVPVGVAGPLVLDGEHRYLPMATTEGCLVASTNRGCKAIAESGGAFSVLLKDEMSRAPAIKMPTSRRAAELKMFLEDPASFDTLSIVFNRSSRFARLQRVQCNLAGRNLYIRFSCSTGDAMGMNMVSKGVQNVLDYLQVDFPDMDVVSLSGNFCADKKAAAVNWIEGRGKSVVCEAIIKEEVVVKVLKTTVPALVELNVIKNLAGSAVAGSLGGFNAHASNIVSAIFIATGQDPAQIVESSQCITMMEYVNGGKDLHISVTMPSIEVGTVGGGTQLASQAACLDLLGVKGANLDSPGANARCLATIIAGSVLAGELSLMSALAAGQLVKSHMKYNRSSKDVAKADS